MNKTLLLIIVDFLFLNLIALTRWEKAEPVRPQQPPVPQMAANAATSRDQDLVETMRQALVDEQGARDELARKLSSADSTLTAREQSIAEIQAEKGKLAASLANTQAATGQLGQEVAAAHQEATLTKDEIAQLERELDEKNAEAERQKEAYAALEKENSGAHKEIEGLTLAVVVGESEKQHLQEQAAQLQAQVQTERAERMKVQEETTQLAQGVGQLAQNSGDLTREIRDNRPISINVLFSDFLTNRVQTTFATTRDGFFGPVDKSKAAYSIFTTDGNRVYALVHAEDTTFTFGPDAYDWNKIAVTFDRPPAYPARASAVEVLAADPRVVVVPLEASQVATLGVKVYPIAADPFKFSDAVLISASGKGYGEVGFRLDAAHPGYVRVDNRFFKRLFGDFAPSAGDLVLSHTGELLGIMVNDDYCVLVKDFTPDSTLRTGNATASEQTGRILDQLGARVLAMPQGLQ